MTTPFFIDRQKLYELAEWLVTGMTLILGLRYLKQIIAYVLMELYRIFIRRGGVIL